MHRRAPAHDETLAALKRRVGLAPQHISPDKAEVDGYFVEGHVPAEDIKRLLAERPTRAG